MRRGISDEVVIVAEYDPLSAAGIERLKGLFREDLTYDRTWVLLNKLLPDFVQSFSDFLQVAKYLSPIPWDADVVRAYSRRRLALDLENGNEHTLAVLQCLKSLLAETIAAELDAWAQSKAAAIRQPIEEQYRDTEKELDGLLQLRFRLESHYERSRRRKLLSIVPVFEVMTLLFVTIILIIWSPKLGMGDRLISFRTPFEASVFVLLVLSLAAILALRIWHRFSMPEGVDEKTRLEEFRIRRHEATLEDRLRKLEALRAADLETLIKQ